MKETYVQARDRLLAECRTFGWDVRTSGIHGALKTPYVTTPLGMRFHFSTQAIHFGLARHSTFLDMREIFAADLIIFEQRHLAQEEEQTG